MRAELDNPVWHSLTGPRRSLGRTTERAGLFDPEVSPFGALRDPNDPQSWRELASLVGSSKPAVLLQPLAELPEGWKVLLRIPCVQMVATPSLVAEDNDFLQLGPSDVPEMLDLVERTRPGPFGKRTVDFGGYIGVRSNEQGSFEPRVVRGTQRPRSNGALIAMAGERLRCGGFTEVSAVCTDSAHRGKGLAAALVRALVHRIRQRGEEAFLHAAADNDNAVRLYRTLGFDLRLEFDAVAVQTPGNGAG